jgi:putative phosphoesterase
MKAGIFSDIHGNICAFREVIKSLKTKNTELNIFCGDICGYYYHQNEIIDILTKIENLVCVLGNHDKIFLDMMDGIDSGEEYSAKYGKANKFLLKRITAKNLQFLRDLREEEIVDIQGQELAIFHGSPWNHLDEYIYPTSPIERFEGLPYDFVLLGHTHHIMDRQAGSVKIINSGSCGQPRDINIPSYAILDLSSKKVIFERVDYDRKNLINEINERKEKNNYLIDVLIRDNGGIR